MTWYKRTHVNEHFGKERIIFKHDPIKKKKKNFTSDESFNVIGMAEEIGVDERCLQGVTWRQLDGPAALGSGQHGSDGEAVATQHVAEILEEYLAGKGGSRRTKQT